MENTKTNIIGIRIGSDFGILYDHLLCFDPRFTIRIDEQNEPTLIEIRENPDYIEDFFGRKVSAITALVGKNGVGKSTTLRFVKELFIKENRNQESRHDDIIFFKVENQLKIFLEQSNRNRYEIVNRTELAEEVIYFRDYPKILDRIKNFNTLFYSNSLEHDPYERETLNYYNLSTGFLKENLGKINIRLQNKKIRTLGSQKRFRYTELRRQTEFLNALDNASGPLAIPFKRIDHILMNIHPIGDIDYENLEKLFKNLHKSVNGIDKSDKNNRQLFEELQLSIRKIHKSFRHSRRSMPAHSENFQSAFYENLVVHLLRLTFDDRDLLQEYGMEPAFGREILHAFDRVEMDSNNFRYFSDLIRELLDLFKKQEAFTGRFDTNDTPSKKPKPRAIISKLGDIQKFEAFFRKNWTEFDYRKYALNFHTRSALFQELFDEHYPIGLDMPFLDFRWPSLSAGEESLVAYFSRLYSVLNDIRNRNALMLIDEGDLYFHPEWQRDYIFYLLEFLNSDLLPPSGIQIIVTTHSPFILSDLPRENIILMTKRESTQDRPFAVEAGAMDHPTFGGNLHKLFSKAFFLGDSATSSFARKKIKEEIIDPLQSGAPIRNRAYIRQLIERIGEPVLQDILKERLERGTNG
jgi:predicted ATPase